MKEEVHRIQLSKILQPWCMTHQGTYEVILEVSNSIGMSVTALASYITVHEPAESVFDHAVVWTTALFDNQSLNAGSYLWDFGDGTTSMEPNPVHIYNALGTYQVMLIARNNGCADTLWQTVEVDGTLNTTPGQGLPCDQIFTTEGCGEFTGSINGNISNPSSNSIALNTDVMVAYPNPNSGVFKLTIPRPKSTAGS